jgi:hypothetical protein
LTADQGILFPGSAWHVYKRQGESIRQANENSRNHLMLKRLYDWTMRIAERPDRKSVV